MRLGLTGGGSRVSETGRQASLFALFVAISALTRLVVAHADAINVDEASYMVGASELLAGRLPYVAFGDNKPPLVYAYYAVAQLAFGGGIGSVRLLTSLVTVPLTAHAVSAFYGHDRRGIAGALLFLCYSAAYRASDMLAVNCELLMLLPLAWGAACIPSHDQAVRWRRSALAGVCLGLGVLVKYQAIFWAPACTAAILFGGSAWRPTRTAVGAAVVFCVGIALPLAGTAVLFWKLGGLDDFLYWNVTHNVEYLQNPVTLGETLRRMAERLGPFLLVTSLLWYGWYRSASRVSSTYWSILVPGLIGGSAAAAFLGLRFFPHYFVQLYVPLALAAAPWAGALLAWPIPTEGRLVAAATVLLMAGWTAVNTSTSRIVEPRLNQTAARVADRLRADRCYRGGSLFVWGSAPEFYYHARLRLATRYFFPEYPLVRYFAGNPIATATARAQPGRARRGRGWQRLLSDLRRTEPAYILDTAPAAIARWQYFPLSDFPALEQLVRRRYDVMDVIDGVVVYRHASCR